MEIPKKNQRNASDPKHCNRHEECLWWNVSELAVAKQRVKKSKNKTKIKISKNSGRTTKSVASTVTKHRLREPNKCFTKKHSKQNHWYLHKLLSDTNLWI